MRTHSHYPLLAVLALAASAQAQETASNMHPLFLLIDEDSIDNGNPPNFFSEREVNDDLADLAVRSELRYFDANKGKIIQLHTGTVGDEGWYAVKHIPASWTATGPTPSGLANFLGDNRLPYPHNVGPGLGTGSDPEVLLDKIPLVTPLRATGLKMLIGRVVVAVVYDGDVGINYGPLNGSLKGPNLGTVAFEVLDVQANTSYSTGSLPVVTVRILNAEAWFCRPPYLRLFKNAPEPSSSSEPFDVIP